MVRVTGRIATIRSILQCFDNHKIVSPQKHVVANLLNVDWSGVLARDILVGSDRAHHSVHGFLGQSTISTEALVRSYEPHLLEVVQSLMRHGETLSPVRSLRNPLECCALYGWARLSQFLLDSGIKFETTEDNLQPEMRAQIYGWMDVREQLLRASASESVKTESNACQQQGKAEFSFVENEPVPHSSARKPESAWMELSLPRHPCTLGNAKVFETASEHLSIDSFTKGFLLPKIPLVIRGAAAKESALQWSPQQLCDVLSNQCHGTIGWQPRVNTNLACFSNTSYKTYLSTIPYPDYYMPPDLAKAAKTEGDLHDILQGSKDYLFCEVDELSPLGRLLARELDVAAIIPYALSRKDILIKQFCVGQSGTGAPWHWHEDAFNVCLSGERVWYFRPPSKGMMSREPVAEGVPLASESMYAIQKPGDIIYVPESWSHSVVNRTLSVAISVEIGTTLKKIPLMCRDVSKRHKLNASRGSAIS